MEALGRALERTAYPAGGAVAGAALGGPAGAAGGAAAGHLLGTAVVAEAALGADPAPPGSAPPAGGDIQVGFEVVAGFRVLGLPLWLWAILALVVALRAPWIPHLVRDWWADLRERREGPR